jgi:hypothetical protein
VSFNGTGGGGTECCGWSGVQLAKDGLPAENNSTPEPFSMALGGGGLFALGMFGRRRLQHRRV